jgi:DNA-binding NtrC family response regulator
MDCVQERPGSVEASAQLLFQTVVTVGQSHPQQADLLAVLRNVAREVLPVEDPAAVAAVLKQGVDLVLLCEGLSPEQTLGVLQDARMHCPDVPVVVVAREPAVDLAVRFVRAGAYDYLAGPIDEEHLRRLVAGMKREGTLRGRSCDRFISPECPPDVPIVGRSPGMTKALQTIRLVSQSRCNPVLIVGETGTGKELAAQAVHAWRCGGSDQFVAINCAALTANLLESELFGHVKGAFTGADREKVGLVELAGSGTIFLDEISEMPPELQAKLLRVLQERTFRKVGGTKDICCNATIIASSNRDLPGEVRSGRFRRDLYYRLAVFPISIPPLRCESRRADIPLLAEYFLATSDIRAGNGSHRLSAEAQEMLLRHDWPGNVRELRNVIERAMILTTTGEIAPSCLVLEGSHTPLAEARGDPPSSQVHVPASCPPLELPVCRPMERTLAAASAPRAIATDAPRPGVLYLTQAAPATEPLVPSEPIASAGRPPVLDFSLEAAERELIIRALRETGWQRTRAAALLGITRATLHAKLKRYDIKVPGGRGTSQQRDRTPIEGPCLQEAHV